MSTFIRALTTHRLISEETATRIIREARERGKWLPALLFSSIDDPDKLIEAIGKIFMIPIIDIDAVNSTLITETMAKVPDSLFEYRAVPLFILGRRLYLAVGDPMDERGIDDFRFHFQVSGVQPVFAHPDKIEKLLANRNMPGLDRILDEDASENDGEDEDNQDVAASDSPVAMIVNRIIQDAVSKGASDIHFEPMENHLRIRCRHDGLLAELAPVQKRLSEKVISRIKVLADMNISERRIPQDGRIRLKLFGSKQIDFRVNTCPTLHGEKAVLRVLDSSVDRLDIDNLGMDDRQKQDFLRAIHKPYGLILVTGPTGSGKTVTLYTALSLLNRPEINISTAEDPVEITLPGINQVNINNKVGLTFADALRAFLRQDPDVIMVGEIRDLETAETAIKAAQTGHLVLSTLHTNDAPQTLNRLAQMGIEPFNIAASVLLVLAQRLVRKLCPHCRIPIKLDPEMIRVNQIPEGNYYRANPDGCGKCVAGYRGRIGIFQVLPVNEDIQRLIVSGAKSMDIEKAALEMGVITLRMSAMQKVAQGLTSMEEANRVTLE